MSAKALSWFSRAVRLSVTGVVVVGCFGTVVVRTAEARASDTGLTFGDQLMSVMEGRYSSGAVESDVYRVQLNGQTFNSTNVVTHRAMHEVLSHFATQCKVHAEGLSDSFKNLHATVSDLTPSTSGVEGALVVQREEADHGFVFCVAPDHKLTETELMSRLGVVGETGDVSKAGNLRYVGMRRQPNGDFNVVTAWTEGKLELYSMYSDASDVPGQDFGNVPRPDGGRRILSATIDGAPGGVNSYLVKGARADVLAGLDGTLKGAGWQALKMPEKVPHVGVGYSLGGNLQLIVSASPQEKDTLVTYVVSRGLRATSR
jgi:hypothetical protein